MLTTHTLRRMQTGAIALALIVGMASMADARVFRMTGAWQQNRSAQLKVPPIGPGVLNAPGALVSAVGSKPASLTVPPAVFTGLGPAIPGLDGFVFALPKTTLVQISTMFSFSGPGSTGFLVPGTKTSRPANFSFCPGAAVNPNCTVTASGGSQGTQHGRIVYTAGPNHFGGTMQMLTGGAGSLSALVGTSPQRVQHNTIGGLASATVSMLPAVNGGYYSNNTTLDIPAGPITTGGVCAGGPCGTNGVVTQPGVVTGAGTASFNTNVGFPWTTGMMFGIATEDLPTQPSTFTFTGSDSRTDLGLGNITLVSGGISHRFPADSVFIQADKITMTFKAQNLPSMSPTGIAALAALVMMGGGYAVTRRRK